MKWRSGRIAKKRKKDSGGCFGQESRKKNQHHRGSSKEITLGRVVVQLRKQEITVSDNNAIGLQIFF